jgi:hypothetical protein
LPVGFSDSAHLFLPGPESLLKIEIAVVRRVMDNDFGVEFLSMPPSDRDRLRHFLSFDQAALN